MKSARFAVLGNFFLLDLGCCPIATRGARPMSTLMTEVPAAGNARDKGPAACRDHGPNLPGAVQAESFRLRIPSRPEWIVPTVEYLTDRFVHWSGCLQDRASKVTLALHEAVTNSIVHGNLGVSS